MDVRLEESGLIVFGCAHSHEIPEKAPTMLLSQACHAKLGMMKRVRGGSISLEDYGGQSLEVAQQIGSGLFIIRIDHLTLHDYAGNSFLSDLLFRSKTIS